MIVLRKLLGWSLLLTALLLAFVNGGPRSVVDWQAQRAVGLQSDDWGLAGVVPQADSWLGLDREALQPGRFPAVYWQSTLEDASVVQRLIEILRAHPGRDGVPAVFQPNYVMASLGWDAAAERWVRYNLPQWPPQYERPGLWGAVVAGRQLGVWRPEFHASLHYDPAERRERALSTDLAREVTRRGISIFPASEGARELAPWRSEAIMTAELDTSLAVFSRVFGRPVDSVIAPDYTWHAWVESLWQSRGLRVIQAKREQQNPEWLAGKAGRLQKYLDRQWARLVHQDRVYLERNCRLEPVQAVDPGAVVRQCVADTRRAWRRGQPAIVESHRVNYSHTDPEVAAVGMAALTAYLAQVCDDTEGPVFLCDSEIAQLVRRGTSWRVAGDRLVLRNSTHAGRVVAVPGRALVAMGLPDRGPVLIRLGAAEVRVLQAVEISASRGDTATIFVK